MSQVCPSLSLFIFQTEMLQVNAEGMPIHKNDMASACIGTVFDRLQEEAILQPVPQRQPEGKHEWAPELSPAPVQRYQSLPFKLSCSQPVAAHLFHSFPYPSLAVPAAPNSRHLLAFLSFVDMSKWPLSLLLMRHVVCLRRFCTQLLPFSESVTCHDGT